MLVSSWVAAQLATSQEGISSMKLVNLEGWTEKMFVWKLWIGWFPIFLYTFAQQQTVVRAGVGSHQASIWHVSYMRRGWSNTAGKLHIIRQSKLNVQQHVLLEAWETERSVVSFTRAVPMGKMLTRSLKEYKAITELASNRDRAIEAQSCVVNQQTQRPQ
jgi:hypothetical protein